MAEVRVYGLVPCQHVHTLVVAPKVARASSLPGCLVGQISGRSNMDAFWDEIDFWAWWDEQVLRGNLPDPVGR